MRDEVPEEALGGVGEHWRVLVAPNQSPGKWGFVWRQSAPMSHVLASPDPRWTTRWRGALISIGAGGASPGRMAGPAMPPEASPKATGELVEARATNDAGAPGAAGEPLFVVLPMTAGATSPHHWSGSPAPSSAAPALEHEGPSAPSL